jgi:tetratricopeptide (TPR) repeat protein
LPLSIDDLQLESHHRGKVLVLRCIEQPIRSAAIQTIVEDSNGAAERLALYNVPSSFKFEDILPQDLVLAIKEPYYEQSGQGSCIRVDHPSDIVALSLSSRLLPESFRPSENKSALELKDEGNAAYGSKNYLLAFRIYTSAIDAISNSNKTEDISLKRLILRNRAMVHLYLGHFESALSDAKEAAIPQDEAQGPADVKRNTTAYYRAGRAAYELHWYSEAEIRFNKALELSPGDADSLNELRKIKDRQKETAGEYDFSSMSTSTNKKQNRLDKADFTSGTTIRDAGEGRGRGLFASKDFTPGDLVMCEKGLSVSFDSDTGASNSYTILDSKTEKRASDTTASLLFQLTDKLARSPTTAARFFDLHDAGYSPQTPLTLVDGIVPVDTFRTLAIIHHNTYGCPTVRSSSNAAQAQLASSTGYPSSGLWIHASYVNHACNGNAMRSFIGDMMILRATRNIKQGDEICMPYRLPHPDKAVTQGELQKIWGFKCDCSLCRVEAATPGKDKKQRTELIGKAMDFLSKNKLKEGVKMDKKTIDQAARMYERLQKTYDEKKFDKMPRPGLVGLGMWLCEAYVGKDEHTKVIEYALRLLRNMGFVVKVNGEDLVVHREFCCLEVRSVGAAVYASKAYKAKGNTAISQKMEVLARDFYEILNGEIRGFDDRYVSQ